VSGNGEALVDPAQLTADLTGDLTAHLTAHLTEPIDLTELT
jgi:hypothetical protein